MRQAFAPTGSLLVTSVIRQAGAGSLSSETSTATDTGTTLLSGGHKMFGVAVICVIAGARTCRTVASAFTSVDVRGS